MTARRVDRRCRLPRSAGLIDGAVRGAHLPMERRRDCLYCKKGFGVEKG